MVVIEESAKEASEKHRGHRKRQVEVTGTMKGRGFQCYDCRVIVVVEKIGKVAK